MKQLSLPRHPSLDGFAASAFAFTGEGDTTELLVKAWWNMVKPPCYFFITWALAQNRAPTSTSFEPCLAFSAAEILWSNSALADFTCAEWSPSKKKAVPQTITTLAPPAPLYRDQCAQWDVLPLVASMQSSLCVSRAPVAMTGWSFDYEPEPNSFNQFQWISLNKNQFYSMIFNA